jgi:hypothetical protein
MSGFDKASFGYLISHKRSVLLEAFDLGRVRVTLHSQESFI